MVLYYSQYRPHLLLHNHNCWPATAFSFPFLGPGFISMSPARSSRRLRKAHVWADTALVKDSLRRATCLKNTRQGLLGLNCGGSKGNTIWDTDTLQRGSHCAFIREHAVWWSPLTLMRIPKDLCTVNDTTKRPCIFLPDFTPLRRLREGSFVSTPQICLDTARCLYLQNEMDRQFLLFKTSFYMTLYLHCKHKVLIET